MSKQHARIVLAVVLVLAGTPDRAGAQTKDLPLPGKVFAIDGCTAFVIEPQASARRDGPLPWVWYAPTLKGLPGAAERWMFDRFLAAGIAIAGVDVGESYGSPKGRSSYQALYEDLTTKRGYGEKPVLLARSRGGLMLYSWAALHPEAVGGIAGIYPVCNLASYPGVPRAAPAYEMTAEELDANLAEHNPIDRLAPLAKAQVPIFHIHGDKDGTVPLSANSAELGKRYAAHGGPVEIMVIEGQGHNMWSGWFQSRELTDFAIAHALGRPRPSPGQAADRLTIDELVDRHIEARGGREALEAIRTLQWRMPPRADGGPVPVMTKKRPFYFVIGELEGAREYAEGNDGSPWEYYADPGLVLRTTGAPAAATRHTAYFDDGLILSRTPGWGAELQGRERIGDREALRVLVRYPDGFEKLVFVDVETFLIIASRITAPVHAFGDPVASETRIGGYIDVNGVLYPTRFDEVEIATGRALSTGQPWSTITANLDFPDELFSPPPAPDTPLARMLNAAFAARAIPSDALGWYRSFREDPATADVDARYGIESVGYQCLKNGAIETAVVLLEANLAEHPDSPSALFGLGRAYRTAGREQEAVERFEHALVIDPGYRRALEALGR